MNRRLGIVIAAAILALLGVIALIAYAHGANDRALQDTKLVSVLQVKSPIPAGTSAEKAAASIEVAKIPTKFKADGALVSLDPVASLSTNTELKPGEQVLKSRFGASGAQDGSSSSAIPDGYQEISISVAAPRVAGGDLKSGDRVGIVVTYGDKTTFLGQQILASRVSGGGMGNTGTNNSGTNFLVTLAVKTLDVEKIVNASENGKIWLTLQNDKTDKGTPKVIGSGDVLK